MDKAVAALIAGVLSAFLCTSASGQGIPKSGSISFRTGFGETQTEIEVADKITQGQGLDTGVTFNDKGMGPLHLAPAHCSYAFLDVKFKGYCTFSDADGDRIFTDFAGTGTSDGTGSGTNQIIGGTGKYAGIQGSGPFTCKPAGRNRALECAQRLDYRLP